MVCHVVTRRRNHRNHILVSIGWLAVVVAFGLVSTALAYTDEQARQGETVFATYCSTCHGDRGQGLTDEFRATWPSEDQNCWKAKCHASSHPPGGFIFPKTVPAIMGPGTLAEYKNAQSLHDFIIKNMPYQQPGLLSEEQYWQLTAFLVRQRGVPSDGAPLSAANAASVQINPDAPPPTQGDLFKPPTMPPQKPAPNTSWVWIIVGVVVIAAGLVAISMFSRPRRPKGQNK